MLVFSRAQTRRWLSFFRRAWHNQSLARKLLFSGAAAVFLVAGVLTATTYVSAEDSLRSQMQRQVRNELRVFERLYEIRLGAPLRAEDPRLSGAAAQRACTEMVSLMGGFAAVFAGDRPLAVAGLDEALGRDALHLPEMGSSEGFATATVRHTPYELAVHPLRDARGRLIGAFVRGTPQKQISDMLQKHAWGIFSIAGTAMLLALIALAWLTREISAPLRRLARASRTLLEDGATDDVLPDPRGSDEVGRLATDFKAIADRLAAQKAALEDKDRLRGHLLEKLISAQEDERRRISRELHDQTGQSLTSLLVGLKLLEKARNLEEMKDRAVGLKDLVHQTLDEVHRLSVELRPAMLDDLGLIPAIRAQAQDFARAHGARVDVQTEGFEGRVAPLVEATVYRVVQEAMTNVAKYARAQQVQIRLDQRDGQLHASVTDDGVGFDARQAMTGKRESLGILGMQERVSLLGGDFELASRPGEGTRVRFRIPIEQGVH